MSSWGLHELMGSRRIWSVLCCKLTLFNSLNGHHHNWSTKHWKLNKCVSFESEFVPVKVLVVFVGYLRIGWTLHRDRCHLWLICYWLWRSGVGICKDKRTKHTSRVIFNPGLYLFHCTVIYFRMVCPCQTAVQYRHLPVETRIARLR